MILLREYNIFLDEFEHDITLQTPDDNDVQKPSQFVDPNFSHTTAKNKPISNNNSLESSGLQSPHQPPRQPTQEDHSNNSSKLNPDSLPFCPQMLPPQLAHQQALYQQQLIQVCLYLQ